MKDKLDQIKPISYNNYQYMETLIDMIKQKVYKRQRQGKDFTCYGNDELLDICDNLKRINLQTVGNIRTLEMYDDHFRARETEFYKKLLKYAKA